MFEPNLSNIPASKIAQDRREMKSLHKLHSGRNYMFRERSYFAVLSMMFNKRDIYLEWGKCTFLPELWGEIRFKEVYQHLFILLEHCWIPEWSVCQHVGYASNGHDVRADAIKSQSLVERTMRELGELWFFRLLPKQSFVIILFFEKMLLSLIPTHFFHNSLTKGSFTNASFSSQCPTFTLHPAPWSLLKEALSFLSHSVFVFVFFWGGISRDI